MRRVKKIIFSLLSFLILFTSSLSYFAVPKVSAADTNPWYFQSFPQWYTKVYDTQTSPAQEIFGERYTAAQVQWVIYSLISIIVYPASQTVSCIFKGGGVDNCIATNPLVAYDPNPKPFENKGVFATLFDSKRSISGVNYVRSKLASAINVIPQARAQTEGFGFQALNPIQNIWRICRDVMYGFFVIIIILFAFMIMFRVKLNPQTVVTIQSAVPKIIITLLLVTFSYAIAGLMIDLMYVMIGIIALIFTSFGLIQGGNNVWAFIFKILTDGPGSTFSFGGIIGWFLGYWWAFVSAYFASFGHLILGGEFGVGGAVVGVLAWLLGIFICIGVFIWLVITMARVFILLIKTYLFVLVSVIFSPFMIGFGSIMPTGGFGSWLKGLITNLLIYPVTGALLLVSVLFLSGTYPSVRTNLERWLEVQTTGGHIINIFDPTTNAQYWYPPLTFGTQNQAGSWDPLPMLWTFASLGVMAMIPNVANMIKSLMAGRGIEGPDLMGKGGALAMGLGLGAMAGRAVGGTALDAALVKSQPAVDWLQSRGGARGYPARAAGRGLWRLAESRGLVHTKETTPGVSYSTTLQPRGKK